MSFTNWLKNLKSRLHITGRTSRRKQLARPTTKLDLEVLEDRWLPSTFTVLNTNDSGAGSMRQAILDANASGGTDTIGFNMAANDAGHVYYRNDGQAGRVSQAFVATTSAANDATITDIDPDYAHSWWSIQPTSPLPTITGAVTIDGYTQAGASVNTLLGADSTNTIAGARGDNAVLRIELSGAAATSQFNGGVGGIAITGGGTTVRGLAINGFRVGNNYSFAVGPGIGIILDGQGSNVIQGNFIGTDISGTLARGNEVGGIQLRNGSSNNTIGGAAPADRNVIAGNGSYSTTYGISLHGSSNLVQGNFIGTDRTGTVALGNGTAGTGVITNFGTGTNNVIGGTAAGAGNLISGHSFSGLQLFDGTGSGTVVQGNFIGTDITGTRVLRNGTGIDLDTPNARIGGDDDDDGVLDGVVRARNIISGNSSNGIAMREGYAAGAVVQGNFIGTDVTGTIALGNLGFGVSAMRPYVTIGGTTAGAGNLISGNGNGIDITVGVVQGNFVGTDVTGMHALGNGVGVNVPFFNFGAATSVRIGGTDADDGVLDGIVRARNLISGNSLGVQINTNWAGSRVVEGNLIGTDVTGAGPLGNGTGVWVAGGSQGATIGGTAAGAGNTIAFNQGTGVGMDGSNNVVQSNAIFSNGGVGVSVAGNSRNRNAVLGNAIYDNGGLGIDLVSATGGVTLNDLGDADGGNNNLQNFPVLTTASSTLTSTTITGTLNSIANSTFRVEFFSNVAADPTGFGEGKTYLGFTNVTTDGSGNASFTATLPTVVAPNHTVTATATLMVALPGPQNRWLADGNTNDSVDSRPGTLQNGATFAAGVLGQAFILDGTNDHVNIGDLGPSTDGSPFSISTWINLDPSEVAAGGSGVIMSNGSTVAGSGNQGFNSYLSVNGQGAAATVEFSLGYTQVWSVGKSTGAIVSAGAWTHVVATYDGSRTLAGMKLYVNGAAVATTDSGSFQSPRYDWNAWSIGVMKSRDGVLTSPFKGQIDEVAFFRRPMTTAEISYYYSDPAAARTQALLVPGDTSEFSGNRIVTPLNQAPAANNDSFTVAEGGSLARSDGRGTITPGNATDDGVLANDTDADGNTLTATLVSGPANAASFTFNSDGSFTYVHNASETTGDSFSYRANDGTANSNLATVTITITPVNDAATLSADTRNLTETNAAADISSSGALTINDIDSPTIFLSQPGTVGSYGTFAINNAGAWTYTASSAHNEFYAGITYTDTFTVHSADGTPTTVTINILGTNDDAVLSADTRNLTETNAAADISSSGALTINDVDNWSLFTPQPGTVGLYGTFVLNATGGWTYTASSAHNEFIAGVTYTDTFAVSSFDGTLTSVTINILGTNDDAALSADTRNLTEGNTAADISSSGALTINDIDSPTIFLPQPGTVGSYGTFAINNAGAWTYTASSAHNEFIAGVTYTDTFTVHSADGTPTTVTINILGTNDDAVLSADTRNLTETNAAADISSSGALTINDVDNWSLFTPQPGTVGLYGTFVLNATGGWTYTASSAHNEFIAGVTYTDTFAVSSFDGTLTSVTINILGTNDDAVLSADTRNLTEGNTAADISSSGALTINDIDSPTIFLSQPGTVGSYGTFAINNAGAWTYTASSAHNEFYAGITYTDTFTVHSADGTATSVTINILGTNDDIVENIQTIPDTCLGGTALLITGTSADDTIVVTPGSTDATLVVTYNGVTTIVARPSGRIIVTGGAGNDNIQIAGAITNSVWLYGDAGNDRLNAGNASPEGNLLIGGDGNDELLGGAGRDIMIGGQGADRLVGNANDDILIAGLTNFDNRITPGHEEFWCHVQHEWTAPIAFQYRVNNLRYGVGATGVNLLANVFDDSSIDQVDMLQGSSGNDWFLFKMGEDKVTGLTEAAN